MKAMNLFIPILLIGNVFNNPNWVPGVNKQPVVGVQAQSRDCSTASDKTDCICKDCYSGAEILVVGGCCSVYLTCKNNLGVDINTCKTAYYVCANNCAAFKGVVCDTIYAKQCSLSL